MLTEITGSDSYNFIGGNEITGAAPTEVQLYGSPAPPEPLSSFTRHPSYP